MTFHPRKVEIKIKKVRRGCGRQSENFQQMTRRDPDVFASRRGSADVFPRFLRNFNYKRSIYSIYLITQRNLERKIAVIDWKYRRWLWMDTELGWIEKIAKTSRETMIAASFCSFSLIKTFFFIKLAFWASFVVYRVSNVQFKLEVPAFSKLKTLRDNCESAVCCLNWRVFSKNDYIRVEKANATFFQRI